MQAKSLSLIVLNHNGRHLLERNIPSVMAAWKAIAGEYHCEFIVVDNGSTDGSVEFVSKNYPDVNLVALPENRWFVGGNNAGVETGSGDIIVFLNNDCRPEKDFLLPLIRHFKEPDVFAVGCHILMTQGPQKETGFTKGRFRRGFVHVEHNRDLSEVSSPILYASGCAFAVDREKFLEIGGFDPLWDPFYWEDVDLSYRAWKRGWRVLFEPDSRVDHEHQATNNSKNFSASFIATAKEKNRYLFVWKNIADARMMWRHILRLPFHLMPALLGLKTIRVAGFIQACMQLPEALKARRRELLEIRRSDRDLYDLTNDAIKYQSEYLPIKVSDQALRILFVCPYLPSMGISAGAGRMFQIIKNLAETHRVQVISFVTPEEKGHVDCLKAVCERVDVLARNYPWNPPYWRVLPSMVDEFYCEDMKRLLYQRMAEEVFDVVQIEYAVMSQYVPEVCRAVTVLTEHQVHCFSFWRDAAEAEGLSEKLWRLGQAAKMLNYEADACKNFDAVVTMTEYEADLLRSFSSRARIEPIAMGVDTEDLRLQIRPHHGNDISGTNGHADLLYVGFFGHPPNVDAVQWLATEIMPIIWQERSETTLRIVGYNPPADVRALGEDSRIDVAGYVEDLREALSKSKVFAMPIRLGAGMRGKLFEAWAMQKAVLSTSVGCEGIMAYHGDNILIADDPQEFALRAVDLLNDPELRTRLGANGRATAERHYQWRHLANKHETLYRDLIEGKARL